jgi:hypothetical protein
MLFLPALCYLQVNVKLTCALNGSVLDHHVPGGQGAVYIVRQYCASKLQVTLLPAMHAVLGLIRETTHLTIVLQIR